MIKYYCDLCGKETNSISYLPPGSEYLSKYLPYFYRVSVSFDTSV